MGWRGRQRRLLPSRRRRAAVPAHVPQHAPPWPASAGGQKGPRQSLLVAVAAGVRTVVPAAQRRKAAVGRRPRGQAAGRMRRVGNIAHPGGPALRRNWASSTSGADREHQKHDRARGTVARHRDGPDPSTISGARALRTAPAYQGGPELLEMPPLTGPVTPVAGTAPEAPPAIPPLVGPVDVTTPWVVGGCNVGAAP
jgi:hypothetical protein